MKNGIKLSRYKGQLTAFGFTTDEIIEIANEEIDDDKYYGQIEKERKESIKDIDTAQVFIDDGSITEDEAFEMRQKVLLKKCEDVFRNYYNAKFHHDLKLEKYEQEKNKAIVQYNVHIFRPDYYDKSVSKNQIERANEIEISKFIQVNNFGFATCIFHKENTPSLHITKNMYYCFGCQTSGKTIDFIVKTRGMSFKDAVNFLCRL